MENLLFIALMVGSFVIRFFMKKVREKKVEEQTNQRAVLKPTLEKKELGVNKFDYALKEFSDKIGKELIGSRFDIKTKSVTSLIASKEDNVIQGNKNERFDRFKIKHKKPHRVIANFKSTSQLKKMIIASEVLKTKF